MDPEFSDHPGSEVFWLMAILHNFRLSLYYHYILTISSLLPIILQRFGLQKMHHSTKGHSILEQIDLKSLPALSAFNCTNAAQVGNMAFLLDALAM